MYRKVSNKKQSKNKIKISKPGSGWTKHPVPTGSGSAILPITVGAGVVRYVGVEKEGGDQEQEDLPHPRKHQGARSAYNQCHNSDFLSVVWSLFKNTHKKLFISKQGQTVHLSEV